MERDSECCPEYIWAVCPRTGAVRLTCVFAQLRTSYGARVILTRAGLFAQGHVC